MFGINYNFLVKADSLHLLSQQPEEMMSSLPIDTFAVYKDDLLVVADIRTIPTDPVDSVWVQLAKDQDTFGWIRKSELITQVVPDDPISQFISICSDGMMHLFFIMMLGLVFWLCYKAIKNKWIDTIYPSILAGSLGSAFALWAILKLFARDLWDSYYYFPTINPFSAPLLLKLFLISIWIFLISALATIDVIVGKFNKQQD